MIEQVAQVLIPTLLFFGFVLMMRIKMVLSRERRFGGRLGYAIHQVRLRQERKERALAREGISLPDAAELRVLLLHDLRLIALLKRQKAHNDVLLAIAGESPHKPSETPDEGIHTAMVDDKLVRVPAGSELTYISKKTQAKVINAELTDSTRQAFARTGKLLKEMERTVIRKSRGRR